MSESLKPAGENKTSEPSAFFFKKTVKRSAPRGRRKSPSPKSEKDSEESSSSSEETTKIVKISREKSRNASNAQSTNFSAMARFRAARGDGSDSDDDKKSDLDFKYKVDANASASYRPKDMGATATLEIDTEKDKDASSIAKRAIDLNKERKGMADDKQYRGLNNYTQFYEKKDSLQGNAGSGLNQKGPIRAPQNIRSTVRWDYDPCICKDWKETGFCGFGDSCKFLHDRTDYKHGWQLEREMEAGTYGDADTKKYEIESSDEDGDLPFKCFICRESFTDPVVTKCKHYFCEGCALERFARTHRCFVCGEPTGGIFNPAKDLEKKLSFKKSQQDGESSNSEVPSEDEAVT